MKQVINSIIIVLMFFQVNAQMTKEEGLKIANQLFEVKILTKKGRNQLINKINDNDFFRYKRDLSNTDSKEYLLSEEGTVLIHEELSKSQILAFLQQAFLNDFYYRTGITTSLALFQEGDSTNLEETIKASEGYQIEENIAVEDSISEEEGGWVMYPFGINNNPENHNRIHHTRSVTGKTRTRTVQDLYKIGLIDEDLYKNTIEKIASNELTVEFAIFTFLVKKAIFDEDYDENKVRQTAYITQLHRANIINDGNFKSIISSYGEKELKSRMDILEYCNRSVVFKLNNYPSDPELGYKAVFEKLKNIISDLQFNDLRQSKESNETFSLNSSFTKTINQFLRDQNSLYRLYSIENKLDNEVGLILLTENEFEHFKTSPHDYSINKQNYDNFFTSKKIANTIDEYSKLGLFSHLTDNEIQTAQNCVILQEINSYQQILNCFPRMTAYVSFEIWELEKPYEILIKTFSEASRGAFMPSNVVDSFYKYEETDNTILSFEFNGKKYEKTLSRNSNRIDFSFISLIQEALADHKINGRFYTFKDYEDATEYIFLTEEQHKFLMKDKERLFSD